MSPSTTEILCAMGLRDRLVGVSTACDYPPAVKKLEKVGMLATPNLEKVLSLKADLFVSTPLQKKHHRKQLAELGVPVCIVRHGNMAELYDAIEQIGQSTGEAAAAAKLVADMKQREQKIGQSVAAIPVGERPRVYVEIGYNPIYTIGRTAFLRDLIVKAGGRSITDSFEKPWIRITAEFVLKEDPDVILLGAMTSQGRGAATLAKRIGWAKVKAVREGRVIDDINPDLILRPGPRIIDGLEQLHRRLYSK